MYFYFIWFLFFCTIFIFSYININKLHYLEKNKFHMVPIETLVLKFLFIFWFGYLIVFCFYKTQ